MKKLRLSRDQLGTFLGDQDMITTMEELFVRSDDIPTGVPSGDIGSAISEWADYTLAITGTTTNPTPGTVTQNKAQWRRVGSNIEIRIDYETSTVGTAGSGAYLFSLPPGIVADESRWPRINAGAGADIAACGTAYVRASTSDSSVAMQVMAYGTGSVRDKLILYGQQTFGPYTISPVSSTFFAMNSVGIRYHLEASFPVVGWSSNINLVEDFTEYASNSSSTDADDTTSFIYGGGGSSGIIGVTNLTSPRAKRVRFTRPINPSDLIFLELYDPSTQMWVAGTLRVGGQSICIGRVSNTYSGGIGFQPVNATDIDIYFFGTPYGESVFWNNAAYSGVKWRVRKVSNGNMAEDGSGIYESGGSGAQGDAHYEKMSNGYARIWGRHWVSTSNGSSTTRTYAVTLPINLIADLWTLEATWESGVAPIDYHAVIRSLPTAGSETAGQVQTANVNGIAQTGYGYINWHAEGRWK
jgi:hypothetical protein